MFGICDRRARGAAWQRRLRVEGLETRWMLAGDTGGVLEAGDVAGAAIADTDWPGFLVSDLNGNVMFADVEDTFQMDLLGSTSIAPYDLAISAEGRVFAVGGPAGASNVLYELQVDFDEPGEYQEPVAISWILADGNVAQISGLEFLADGTLLATGHHNQSGFLRNALYSLDVNTAQATVLVDLYGYQTAGDVTADEEGVVYTTTLDGSLIEIPPDYSGFSVVGDLGVSDVFGLTYGPGPILRGYRTDGTVLNIDPDDASSVVEGTLWSTTVPSTNLVLGATTVFKAPTNLGEVGFVELTEQTAIMEQLWYRFDATHDGYVTVELDELSTTDGLNLTLYREGTDGTLEEMGAGTTRIDYDSAAAGDRYFVEITGLSSEATVRVGNQFEPGTDTLAIHGAKGGDVVELAIGSPYLIDINGIHYEVSYSGESYVTTFSGGTGNDLLRVLGSDGDDEARFDLASLSGTVTGSGFEVNFAETNMLEFDGRAGHDLAEIQGTDGDGQLQLAPYQATLSEGTAQAAILQGEEISIDAAGGVDDVVFEGGEQDDRLDLNPTSGTYQEYVPSGELRDPAWLIAATNIESNVASSGGGIDGVFIRDSAGDEQLTASPAVVTFAGPGYSHEIHDFRQVFAYGMNGGNDEAKLYDTPAKDKFKGKEDYGILRGGGFYFRAKGFEDIEATALAGGDDLAVFFDTSGDDLFTGSYESATMTGSGLTRTANGFGHVLARATSGFDIARLQDSPGRDEFRGRGHKSTFRSLQDDSLDMTVRAFDEVYAESVNGGTDIGKMHDTAGDNHLTGTGNNAQMYINDAGTLDLLYEVVGFETVKAYWSTGTDTKEIVPPTDFTYYEVFL